MCSIGLIGRPTLNWFNTQLLQDTDTGPESFLPFDLDAAFSSAVVLLLAGTVDHSLLRNTGFAWLNTIYAVLEEMVSRGNLIAQFYSTELHQLDENLKALSTMPGTASFMNNLSPQGSNLDRNTSSSLDAQINVSPDFLGEWNSDDGLNGDQLMALANSLNFDHFDWVGSMDFDGFQHTEPILPG